MIPEGDERMPKFILHLYVTGKTPRSLQAASNLRRICESRLNAHYELVLIDVLTQPDLAEEAHVLATPTTVRAAPLPVYRVIGDLSDPDKVIMALGLETADPDMIAETAGSAAVVPASRKEGA